MTGRSAPAGSAGPKRDWTEVATVLLVTAGWIALRHGFLSFMDLVLADETVYHGGAWALLHRGSLDLSPEGSPLYLAWCALWQLLCGGDVVAAYFSQWLATDLLLTLAVLAVLRRGGLPRAAAVGAALFWAGLGVVSYGWPRVSFFAFLIALLGVLAHSERRRYALPAALALATLVRPEYALPLAGVCAVLIVGRRGRGWRAAAATAAIAALTVAALVASPRLWLAFSQHFAMVAPSGPPDVVDHWREHERVTGAVFPGARSVAEAARTNPPALAAHLSDNVWRLWLVAADGLWGRPQGWSAAPGALLLLAVLALGFAPWRGWPPPDRRVTGALVWLLPALIPSVVVLPKAVYSLPALLVGLLALGSCANRIALGVRWAAWGRARSILLAVAAAGVVLLCWRSSPAPRPRPMLETANRLRAVHAALGRPAWRLLENDLGWCVYVGLDRCQALVVSDYPDSTLRALLTAAAPDVVLASRTWRVQRTLTADPDFRRFLRGPEEFGFRRAFETDETLFLLRGLPAAAPPADSPAR